MNFVIDIIVSKAMALAEIAEATDIDKVLSVIRSYISDDAWPIKKDLEEAAKAYYDVKEELAVSVDDSIVLRETCIIYRLVCGTRLRKQPMKVTRVQ